MPLQTHIPNDDFVGATTTYGTNDSPGAAETVSEWLFPVYDIRFQLGALAVLALFWFVVVRRRRAHDAEH